MPTFEIQHSNGKTYEIDAPDQEAAIKYWSKFSSSLPQPSTADTFAKNATTTYAPNEKVADVASYGGDTGLSGYNPEYGGIAQAAVQYPKATMAATGGPLAALTAPVWGPYAGQMAVKTLKAGAAIGGAGLTAVGAEKAAKAMGVPQEYIERFGLAAVLKALEGKK